MRGFHTLIPMCLILKWVNVSYGQQHMCPEHGSQCSGWHSTRAITATDVKIQAIKSATDLIANRLKNQDPKRNSDVDGEDEFHKYCRIHGRAHYSMDCPDLYPNNGADLKCPWCEMNWNHGVKHYSTCPTQKGKRDLEGQSGLQAESNPSITKRSFTVEDLNALTSLQDGLNSQTRPPYLANDSSPVKIGQAQMPLGYKESEQMRRLKEEIQARFPGETKKKSDSRFRYAPGFAPESLSQTSQSDSKWVFESQAAYEKRFREMEDKKIIPPGYRYNGRGGIEKDSTSKKYSTDTPNGYRTAAGDKSELRDYEKLERSTEEANQREEALMRGLKKIFNEEK